MVPEPKADEPRVAAAHAFLRSLNILLKSARMYGLQHQRTAAQYETALRELQAALPTEGTAGLTLGVSGKQLLIDGAPVETSPAEKSFAAMLGAGKLSSIHFAQRVAADDFQRFVGTFVASGNNNPLLAEHLKTALEENPLATIRVNPVRYFASDGAQGEIQPISSVVAGAMATGGGVGRLVGAEMMSLLGDPAKLLQMIAAAEGAGAGGGSGEQGEGGGGIPAGGGYGAGRGSGAGGGSGSGGGLGSGGGAGQGSGAGSGGFPGGASEGAGSAYGGAAKGSGGTAYSSEPLELISASEAMLHPGSAPPGLVAPGAGAGSDSGTGSGADSGAGSGPGSGGGIGPGHGPGLGPGAGGGGLRLAGPRGFAPREDDVMNVLRLLAKVGQASQKPGSAQESEQLRTELAQLQPGTQVTLQQALSSLAATAPSKRVDGPMLVQLAEHMAIQHALDCYERGDTRVNSVKEMLGKMGKEIDTLRKVLGGHEDKLKKAGIGVESYEEALDRQFWASVPESGKRAMLLSSDAWCIPGRNIRAYLEQAFQRGDTSVANDVLRNYAACLCNPDPDARKKAAAGMLDLADMFGRADKEVLGEALSQTGAALDLVLREKTLDLARSMGESFLRLAQTASSQKNFSALRDALELLSAIEQGEGQRDFAQSLRSRLALEKQIPEFVENAIRAPRVPDGLVDIARQHSHISAENLSSRVIRCGRRRERERLVEIARQLGSEANAYLSEVLRSRPAGEAVSAIALLCRLDPLAVEEILPQRLREWNRFYHDMTVRQIAVSGAPERGRLLLKLAEYLDPMVFPGAIDEVGMCGDITAVPALVSIGAGEQTRFSTPFIRVKAIESLGRLRAQDAAPFLRQILESRQALRWKFPRELRVVAAQALKKIDPGWLEPFLKSADLPEAELALLPFDPVTDAPGVRQRAYQRVTLPKTIEAKVATPRADYKIEIREMSIGGGFGQSEAQQALPPGSEADIIIEAGWRGLKAHVLVRDARSSKFAYEIVDIDLEDRLKLRRVLISALASEA